MNHYFDSEGQKYSQNQVKRYIDKAKARRIELCKEERGYVWCFDCDTENGALNKNEYIDMSHNKSVKWCKENRCIELAWDVENIFPRHRSCHQVKDGLDLKFQSCS